MYNKLIVVFVVADDAGCYSTLVFVSRNYLPAKIFSVWPSIDCSRLMCPKKSGSPNGARYVYCIESILISIRWNLWFARESNCCKIDTIQTEMTLSVNTNAVCMLRIPIEQLNRSNSHQITISVWFIVVPNCCLYECRMSEINNQFQIHSAARAYRCLCGWFAFDHLPNDHHQSEIIYVFSSKHFWIIQLILICHHSLGHYLSASAFFIAVDKKQQTEKWCYYDAREFGVNQNCNSSINVFE